MNQLESINIKLGELNSELITLASSMEFEVICEFSIHSCTDVIPWDKLNFCGIYFIEIKNNQEFKDFNSWINNFCSDWAELKLKHKFVPNPRKIRISKHSELKEWMPLYIGKSKNIGGRIHQHIYLEIEKPTFGLKLAARENMKNNIFRLSILKVVPNNYDWVLPVFEKTLRDRFNPIVGRQ